MIIFSTSSLKCSLCLTVLVIIYNIQALDGQQTDRPAAQCTAADGTVYNVGDKIALRSFWYECIRGVSDIPYNRLSGCVDPEGKFLVNGDTYVRGNFVFECHFIQNEFISHKIVGCINEDGEQVKLGETWLYPKNGHFQFRRSCSTQRNGAVVSVSSCTFIRGRFKLEIKPGCYAELDDGQYFTCTKASKDNGYISSGVTSNAADVKNLSNDKECEVIA